MRAGAVPAASVDAYRVGGYPIPHGYEARLSAEQGRLPQAASPHRRSSARPAADGRGRSVLHRRAHPDLVGELRAAGRVGRLARRAPAALRGRGWTRAGPRPNGGWIEAARRFRTTSFLRGHDACPPSIGSRATSPPRRPCTATRATSTPATTRRLVSSRSASGRARAHRADRRDLGHGHGVVRISTDFVGMALVHRSSAPSSSSRVAGRSSPAPSPRSGRASRNDAVDLAGDRRGVLHVDGHGTVVRSRVWWSSSLPLITMHARRSLKEMQEISVKRRRLASAAQPFPSTPTRAADDGEVDTVAVADLAVGDVVLVRPGAECPPMARYQWRGPARRSRSVTGESRPVPRRPAIGSSRARWHTDSTIRRAGARRGNDTALADPTPRRPGPVQPIASTGIGRSVRRLALYVAGDRCRAHHVRRRLPSATPTTSRTVTVLVIACPLGLVAAIPLVISSVDRGRRTQRRYSSRQPGAFYACARSNAASCSTRRARSPGPNTSLTGIAGVGDDAPDLLAWPLRRSDFEHPLARAIVAPPRDHGTLRIAPEFTSITGRGVAAEGSRSIVTPCADHAPPRAAAASRRRWQVDGGVGASGAAVLYVVATNESSERSRSRTPSAQSRRSRCSVAAPPHSRRLDHHRDARQVADAVGTELRVGSRSLPRCCRGSGFQGGRVARPRTASRHGGAIASTMRPLS